MRTILNLFGRSPFTPIEKHMEEVASCVYLLTDLFQALKDKNQEKLEELAREISKREHQADETKNDIRNHLPKGLFLAIDRESLLKILTVQDSIADSAEDIAVLLTLKKLEILEPFEKSLNEFLNKNIETFNGAKRIIRELHELLETSFGGIEAEKVRKMVDDVAKKEHETDLVQRQVLKDLFVAENKMSYSTFFLWMRLTEKLGSISNLSENLALLIRMTLDLK